MKKGDRKGVSNIPSDLKSDLRYAYRVRCWARGGVVEVVGVDGVVHVGLVVRAVEVLAIPAS